GFEFPGVLVELYRCIGEVDTPARLVFVVVDPPAARTGVGRAYPVGELALLVASGSERQRAVEAFTGADIGDPAPAGIRVRRQPGDGEDDVCTVRSGRFRVEDAVHPGRMHQYLIAQRFEDYREHAVEMEAGAAPSLVHDPVEGVGQVDPFGSGDRFERHLLDVGHVEFRQPRGGRRSEVTQADPVQVSGDVEGGHAAPVRAETRASPEPSGGAGPLATISSPPASHRRAVSRRRTLPLVVLEIWPLRTIATAASSSPCSSMTARRT